MAETAFGHTYLGRAPDRPAPVVIRIARPGALEAEAARALVDRQRALAAAPVHPAIAIVRDAGLTADGRPFVVRDYVAGQPFDRFRRDHADPDLVTAVLACVREALEAAHGRGISHGHLVPANVLVALAGGRAAPTLTDVALHGPGPGAGAAASADLVDFAALTADPHSDSRTW